tara:strand:+ start:382 stop:648 length:267 start_codon:yes stop_codon:yes gene_type:complete
MDKYLVSYELFRSRTGFNPYNIIKENTTYEEFSLYLRRRKVNPPSLEVFNAYKKKAVELGLIEIKKEEFKEKENLVKPKRKRRTKKND